MLSRKRMWFIRTSERSSIVARRVDVLASKEDIDRQQNLFIK
jgi:hypothetical protein